MIDDLLPEPLAAMPVIESLAIPRRSGQGEGRLCTTSVEQHYGPNLKRLLMVGEGGGHRVALVDKAFPHSRYDLMVLAADEHPPRSSVTDLSPGTLRFVLAAAVEFVRYISAPETVLRHGLGGGVAHLCFNYNKDTADRGNSMFYDKRFHLHLNCWPERDLRAPVVRLGDVRPAAARRRLVDPLSFLGAQVVADALRRDGAPVTPPDADLMLAQASPVGLSFPIGRWENLRHDDVAGLLRRLHRTADAAYDELYEAFTGEPPQPRPWWRPSLLDPERIEARLAAIGWLSGRSRAGLGVLARSVHSLSPATLRRLRQAGDRADSHLAIGSLDYSMGLYSPDAHKGRTPLAEASDVRLTMQFRLLSDIGGAGVPPVPGAGLARLDRTAGRPLDPAELRDRAAFQDGAIDRIEAVASRSDAAAGPPPRAEAGSSR